MTTIQMRDTVRRTLSPDLRHLEGYVVSEFLGGVKVKLLCSSRLNWRKNKAMRKAVVDALESDRQITCMIVVL